MPLQRDEVRLRTESLTELYDNTLVRFGATEPHAVVKAALANADLYGPALDTLGLAPQAVLAVSCFAETTAWPPSRLAESTRFAHYYTLPAGRVRGLGMELWPTATFHRGVPDRRNPVHFDVVVVRGLDAEVLQARAGTAAQRRVLREQFVPQFQRLLDALDGPVFLPRHR
jgi:hypothetical protein